MEGPVACECAGCKALSESRPATATARAAGPRVPITCPAESAELWTGRCVAANKETPCPRGMFSPVISLTSPRERGVLSAGPAHVVSLRP